MVPCLPALLPALLGPSPPAESSVFPFEQWGGPNTFVGGKNPQFSDFFTRSENRMEVRLSDGASSPQGAVGSARGVLGNLEGGWGHPLGAH